MDQERKYYIADKSNELGDTGFMEAAEKGQSDTVRTLIAAGANVDKVNKHGETALMKAAARGHSEIVKALIEAGARDENTQELVAEKQTYRQAEGVTAIASGDLVSNSQASLFILKTTDDEEYPDPEIEIHGSLDR